MTERDAFERRYRQGYAAGYMAGKRAAIKHFKIDPSDDIFGAVLNCAVRYAIGRETYMPSLVIGFITPLLPSLSSKTLWCFDQDITEAKYTCGYGDPSIDMPDWMRFHAAVRAERTSRGDELYKSWRES